MKRLTHGTDVRKRDSRWLRINWIGAALLSLVVLGCMGIFVYAVFQREVLLCVLILIWILICVAFGVRDALWRNGSYRVTESCLQLFILSWTSTVAWDAVTGYGVFPVYMTAADESRPYIALFLSDKRYRFPLNLMNCLLYRKKMIVIRYTEERLREIAEPLEARGIRREPDDSMYLLDEIDERNRLF